MLRKLRAIAASSSRCVAVESLATRFQMSRHASRPVSRPMAVPLDRSTSSRLQLLAAVGLTLAISTASAAQSSDIRPLANAALAGLDLHETFSWDRVDLSDVPAMDARLAQIMDPRPTFALLFGSRPARLAVQPFEYTVKDGETLPEIAARFGTAVSAVLWNNGLESADQLQAPA